jgi:carbamoylphosphate synthase large subunit
VRGAPSRVHECKAFAEQIPIFPPQLQPTYRVILVNSNPATITTAPNLAENPIS